MKTPFVTLAAVGLVAMLASGEASAQRCTQGPNCPGNGGVRPTPNRPSPDVRPGPNRPAPTPNRPSPDVRPGPNRPTPDYRPGPNRPVPDYRPTPNRPVPDYRPAPSRPPTDYRPHRPNRAPVPRPRVTYSDARRVHTNYYNVYGHRADWRNPYISYTYYTHSPYYVSPTSYYSRYSRPYDFYRTLPYRYVYWDLWVRYPADYGNGYYTLENYPYYVFNGYRHRYSPVDSCDYELVDGRTNSAVRSFSGWTCQQGYDACAQDRDERNYREYGYRYFCSERIDRSQNYNWDYNDDFYSDLDYYGDVSDPYGNDPYYNDPYYNY